MASAAELKDAVEKLRLRKDELKQQLLDKETEIDELKDAYRYSHGLVYFVFFWTTKASSGLFNKCTQL